MDVPEPPAQTPVSQGQPDRDPPFPFSAREVLATSFSIFRRHLPILVVLAAVFYALPTFLELQQTDDEFVLDTDEGIYAWAGGLHGLATMLAEVVLPLAFQAVVTFAVFRTLRGRPPRYGESFLRGVKRLHLALGSGLLVWVIVFSPGFLVFFFGRLWSGDGILIVGLAWIAYMAILACAWYVCVQAAVVEGVGPLTSLYRSTTLTRGGRIRIFGVLLVVYGIPGVLHGVVEAMVLPPEVEDVLDRPRVLLAAGFNVLFAGLQAVNAVVLYHALRKSKEGVDLDELLAVFD
jgi:hypothetical protein